MVSRSNVARRWVQAAVRWGARAAPVLKPALRRRATGLVSQPPLTASLIGASVTTSLRELRTDYIDVLLLHEATAEQLTEPVHDALRSLRQRGLIRAFGVGSDLSKLPAWIERPPDDFGVFQLENNPVVRSLDRFDLSGAKWVVTHRAIGQVYQGIHQRLLEDQKLLARWNRVLDLDVGAPGALARLFLEYARVRNSSGTVLFSSRDEIRIGQNVAVLRGVDTGRLERGQALERLVDELKAGPPW
jgi:diketogulonate reductase-like aldo/keto reductase